MGVAGEQEFESDSMVQSHMSTQTTARGINMEQKRLNKNLNLVMALKNARVRKNL